MRRFVSRALFALLVALIIVGALFPFYHAVVTSMKSGSSLVRVDLFPLDWSLANYASVFRENPFARNIWSSVVVASSVVALSLLLGLTAAYALARVRFRGRATLLLAILGVSMFPQVAVLSGMFQLV